MVKRPYRLSFEEGCHRLRHMLFFLPLLSGLLLKRWDEARETCIRMGDTRYRATYRTVLCHYWYCDDETYFKECRQENKNNTKILF